MTKAEFIEQARVEMGVIKHHLFRLQDLADLSEHASLVLRDRIIEIRMWVEAADRALTSLEIGLGRE